MLHLYLTFCRERAQYCALQRSIRLHKLLFAKGTTEYVLREQPEFLCIHQCLFKGYNFSSDVPNQHLCFIGQFLFLAFIQIRDHPHFTMACDRAIPFRWKARWWKTPKNYLYLADKKYLVETRNRQDVSFKKKNSFQQGSIHRFQSLLVLVVHLTQRLIHPRFLSDKKKLTSRFQ